MLFHHVLNQDSMIHHSSSNLPTHATLQNSTRCQSNPRSFKNVFISYSPFTYSLPKDRILLHKLLLCYCSSSTHPLDLTASLLAGNLTKHMKSKAHSKKCIEMGVPEGLIEDQDAEDSGTVLHCAD